MLDQNTDRMWYVIGAVIVGAAIIFLANGTLPTLFASVTDTFNEKVDDAQMFIQVASATGIEVLHRDSDFTEGLDTNVYRARPGTFASLDPDMDTQTGSTAIRTQFTRGHFGDRGGVHDFVLWFDTDYTNSINFGDTLEVSYYAKSETAAQLGMRVGGVFESDVYRTYELTDEWQYIRYRTRVDQYYVNSNSNDGIGAVVFWSETPSTVWLSDIEVQVHTSN